MPLMSPRLGIQGSTRKRLSSLTYELSSPSNGQFPQNGIPATILMSSRTKKQSSIESLPNEILLAIFKELKISHLKSVLLVCYRWYLVGQNPRLWNSACLTLNYRTVDMADSILESKGRFIMMTRLKFFAWCVPLPSIEAVLELLINQDKVIELVFRGNALWQVDKNLLSSCLNKMTVLKLTKVCFTYPQIQELFHKMEESRVVVELDIRENDLSSVPSTLLSSCVNRMERVILTKCNLNPYQLSQILNDMSSHGTRLRELDIRGNDNLFRSGGWIAECEKRKVVLYK